MLPRGKLDIKQNLEIKKIHVFDHRDVKMAGCRKDNIRDISSVQNAIRVQSI